MVICVFESGKVVVGRYSYHDGTLHVYLQLLVISLCYLFKMHMPQICFSLKEIHILGPAYLKETIQTNHEQLELFTQRAIVVICDTILYILIIYIQLYHVFSHAAYEVNIVFLY